MDTELKITECTEDDYAPHGKRPPSLQEIGTDRIVNRRIKKWACKGSYGMGGPGFLGLLLEKSEEYPKEWIILALWGSYDWVLLDGARLDSQVKMGDIPFETFFAVLSRFLGKAGFLLIPILGFIYLAMLPVRIINDDVRRKLKGSVIYEAGITENNTVIKTKKKYKTSVLETPLPGPDLKNGKRRVINCNHLEAWKISSSGKIFC